MEKQNKVITNKYLKSNNEEFKSNKAIEEMARDLFDCLEYDEYYASEYGEIEVDTDLTARNLYKKGYRKQEWISVEDRLPDKEGEYLVFTQNKNINVMPFFTKRNASAAIYGQGFCVWERGRRTNDDDWWKPVKYITHWMPLPQKPKMKGAE